MPTTKPVAVISSTARDLPEHRKQVMDACHRCTCDYVWMETLPASNDDAVKASMDLVDKADVYIGAFAHRYGYVPPGSDISITEMEYERATKRGIPQLVFFMHDEHPITKAMVETGPGADKLDRFKRQIGDQHVTAFFKSPEDLRGHVLHALPEALKRLQASESVAVVQTRQPLQHIPRPPEPYIAHYYALLETGKIIGRRKELDLLTTWISESSNPMFQVIAIGGMGKSALTWHWFNQIAPREWPKIKGRIWWSFYESDAHFDNFVTRSLMYISGQPESEIRKQNGHDRRQSLLRILRNEPYLIVLDGLERILTSYARAESAYHNDDEIDKETSNAVMIAPGVVQGYHHGAVGRHPSRLAIEPEAGRFLKELVQPRSSRIVTSSRLFPADLQMNTGESIAGVESHFLEGLDESDAVELWRAYGCKGSRKTMIPIFRSFGVHPLVLKVFAGRVANYRLAPGDFDAWHKANPDFNPYGELTMVRSHVLAHALRDLSDEEKATLEFIAVYPGSLSIDTLVRLLVVDNPREASSSASKSGHVVNDGTGLKPLFREFSALDSVLTGLEERGLLGWDRPKNRYDLHPLVRGVVRDWMKAERRQAMAESISRHFSAVPTKDYLQVESLDDLTPAITLFQVLVDQGKYDEAFDVFDQRLHHALHYRLSANGLHIKLLKHLFPETPNALPRLSTHIRQYLALDYLALAHQYDGQPNEAAAIYDRASVFLDEARRWDPINACIQQANIADALRVSGHLRWAEAISRAELIVARKEMHRGTFNQHVSIYPIGRIAIVRGRLDDAELGLRRCLRLMRDEHHDQGEGYIRAYLAEASLMRGDHAKARTFADRALELAGVMRFALDIACAARVQGAIALLAGNLEYANERLRFALKQARTGNLVEEELPALIALAELRRRQNESAKALEYVDEVWDKSERGPYPLFHTDAFNVLAQIERDAGDNAKAVDAATQAYLKAWCDGPPYAYHWGLAAAKKHLTELGAPFPDMPAFDESKYPPMPVVEINPRDEHYVEPEE